VTINEKLECLDSALLRFTEFRRDGKALDFTDEECRAVMAAIDVAASVCELFRERERS
jgi:hypothetical protein